MSIQQTFIEGLDSKTMQAYVNTLQMPLSYQGYFPLKKMTTFNWKTMSNVLQQPNVAAELRAQNSTNSRKSRPIMQSSTGDLPLMTISREMKRSDMKEYQTMLALAGGDTNSLELIKMWADDVSFCFNGINSEYEYIAWSLISSAGKLAFNEANNVYFANEFDLDYQVDSDSKTANSTAWSDSANAKPLTDFQTIVKAGKAKGHIFKDIWMSMDNWYLFQSTDQIKDLAATYTPNNVRFETTPSLEQVNSAIKNVSYLGGLTIHVVDSLVTREDIDGNYTSANPFANNVAVFTESTNLGTSQYCTLQQNLPQVTYAYRNNAIIKKYGIVESHTDITIGESDGIPVLDTAYRNHYLKTNTVAW